MKSTAERLLAAEVIKRAELLRDKDAAAFAAQARRDGAEATSDKLRAQFQKEHPYQEYLEKVLSEIDGVAQLIRLRLPE